MGTIGVETQVMLSKVENPKIHIWKSKHVDQYRWVLTFGKSGQIVYNGNAKTLDQAMSDIGHCHEMYRLEVQN